MARLALTLGGAIIGNMIAPGLGTSIGAAIGGTLGAYLFPPEIPDQVGPRLQDLSVGGGREGASIPITWGRSRISGHVICADDLTETKKVEEVGGKGGGGATVTTFTYSLTYATAFGECRPNTGAALRRLWSNKKLYEDYTASSTVAAQGQPINFYDGTQTDCDPDLEALVGTGNCPAYKNIVYGVYADRQLADFANRAPLDEAEICADYTRANSVTSVVVNSGEADGADGGMAYSEATGKLYITTSRSGAGDDGFLYVVDPWSKTVIQSINIGNTNDSGVWAASSYGKYGKGDWIAVYARNGDGITIYDAVNGMTELATSATANYGILAESERWLIFKGGTTSLRVLDKAGLTFFTISNPGGETFDNSAVRITANNFLVMMVSHKIYPLTIDSSTSTTWGTGVTNAEITEATYPTAIRDDDDSIWWVGQNYLYETDIDGNWLTTYDSEDFNASILYWGGDGTPAAYYDSTTRCIFLHSFGRTVRFSIDSRTADVFTDAGSNGNSWCYYHNATNELWTGLQVTGGSTYVYAEKLGNITASDIDAADVIEDICDLSGMAGADYDASAITATLSGYVHDNAGAAASAVNDLLQIATGYAVSTDWVLEFHPFGGASVKTIDADDLGCYEYGASQPKPLVVQHPKSTTLPKAFELQYLSDDNSLQPGLARSEIPSSSSKVVASASFNVLLGDDDAADLTQKLLLLLSEQISYKFTLPYTYANLDAGDIVTVPTDQGNVRARLTQVDLGSNHVVSCEAVADNAANVVAVTQAAGGYPTQSVGVSSPAELILLDTPLLRDADTDQPGPYVTAFTYGSSFPGVSLQYSADGQTFTAFSDIVSEPNVGRCTTVPAAVDFEDWDETNTIRVTMLNGGTLASATEANVLAGGNAAAWGRAGRWEIVQFKTVSLVSAGVYDVSDLLRGRRGTDNNMDSHVSGDYFVMLSDSTVSRQILAAADIGSTLYYKAVNAGSALSDAWPHDWTVGTEPLEPYSPINLSGVLDGSDVDLTWDWRTRKNGVYGGTNSLTDGVLGTQADETTGKVYVCQSDGTVLSTLTASTDSRTVTSAELSTAYSGTPDIAYFTVGQDASNASAGVGKTCDLITVYVNAYISEVMGHSPIAYYRHGEAVGTTTCSDYSGNGYNGTYNSGAKDGLGATGLIAPGSDTAVHLDGANDYAPVDAVGAAVDGLAAVSIVVWVASDVVPSANRYICNMGGAAYIYVDSSGYLVAGIHNGTANVTCTYTTAISATTTYMISITYDGTNVRLYQNDSLVATSANTSGTITQQQTSYDIGANDNNNFWDGVIDETAIFGSALSGTNISDLYTAGT